ncbi:hypothetical protein Ancab_022751 [Ancistrocladus abbreviatus]
MHATSKAGGSQSAKIPSVSSRFRQYKKVHTEVACEQRVQLPSQAKAERREKAGVSRSAGEQDIQTVEVQSGETPLRFLFQKLNKSKKKGIKQKLLSSQQTDREGMEFRDKSIGPILAGPSNLVHENVPNEGALAQISHELSAQEKNLVAHALCQWGKLCKIRDRIISFNLPQRALDD